MAAEMMDGPATAARLLDLVGEAARDVERALDRRPCLAVVLDGADDLSVRQARMKSRRASRHGVDVRLCPLDPDGRLQQVTALVTELDQDPSVDGVLVQHPMPAAIDERRLSDALSPTKDVDGASRASLTATRLDQPGHRPATAAGILRLLRAYDVPLRGRPALVIGADPFVALPTGQLLEHRGAEVLRAEADDADLQEKCCAAEVLISAARRPGLITGDSVGAGAVVVDAAYGTAQPGDVDVESVRHRASLLAPVPGGVGPMTVAVLLEQTVTAAAERCRRA